MLDSTTVVYIGKILTLNPSWSLVTLLIVAGIGYLLLNLTRNTSLTERIFKTMESHGEMAETIKTIRVDQIKSNEERQKQGIEIVEIKTRLDVLERDVTQLKNK